MDQAIVSPSHLCYAYRVMRQEAKRETADAGKKHEKLTLAGLIKITMLGFATTAMWGSMHAIILPLRLLEFVSESRKNTYLGIITFSGLILAMLIQPVAGYLSDHTTLRWGRRKPYVVVGITLTSVFLIGIGISHRFTTIFLTYCLLQVASNTAQGPYHAYLPELVGESERGRASGVKSLLEILGGVALLYPVAFLMDSYYLNKDVSLLYLALLVLGVILLAVMAATAILVREPVFSANPFPGLTNPWRRLKIGIPKNGVFLRFLLSRLLFFLSFTTIQTFALYFLRDVAHVASPAAATARFSIAAVSGMLLAVYPAGKLSDRLGRRPVGATSGFIGALGILVVFFFPQQYILIMLSGGVIGVAFGAFISTDWALATDLVPAGEEARYLGLANLATTGGAALARFIGPLIDLLNGQSTNQGYFAMLLICFGAILAGSWLLLGGK
ncbi:MAG: MFS transporter [Chloroflexota bacterium]